MMAWWYRPKHVVTLNNINIYNTSCVWTCEFLLLICMLVSLHIFKHNSVNNFTKDGETENV
jgi:hypothetical protein